MQRERMTGVMAARKKKRKALEAEVSVWGCWCHAECRGCRSKAGATSTSAPPLAAPIMPSAPAETRITYTIINFLLLLSCQRGNNWLSSLATGTNHGVHGLF